MQLFACWVILQFFCWLLFFVSFLFFFKINIFNNLLQNTIRVSNSLDRDQGLIWVQSVLLRLSTDDTSRQSVNEFSEDWHTRHLQFVYHIYSEENVYSVFMFSHKINNTGYIIVKL